MKSAATQPRRRPAATPPAWHQAACYGRRDAGDLTAINPYAEGSQCWIIYEQARRLPANAQRPTLNVQLLTPNASEISDH